MTPQDQQMIDGLIDRIRSTQITDRDADAAARLQQGLGNNPDAIYILAQTVLIQQHSLEQAHAQLDQMEQQASQTRQQATPQQPQPTSWLDRFFGSGTSQPRQGYSQQPPQPGFQQVNVPPPSPQYGYPQPGYAPQAYSPQGYAPQGYGPQGYGYGAPQAWGQSTSTGGGSFLRNAAQTAAGVAAGEMLFQGVESMFGGHHGDYGGHEHESVVNNYYEDRGPEHEHHAADTDSSFYNPKDDASRGDSASERNFADTGDSSLVDDQDNGSSFDVGDSSNDSNSDDSSFDDNSSSDDSN